MTTFHHLVREQSRSQATAQRLRQLHKADIEKDEIRRKYKELCKAHMMQQGVVKKVRFSFHLFLRDSRLTLLINVDVNVV